VKSSKQEGVFPEIRESCHQKEERGIALPTHAAAALYGNFQITHETPQLIGDLSCEKTDKKFLFDQMIFDEQEN